MNYLQKPISFIFIITFFISCTEEHHKVKVKSVKPFKKNLINPLYLDQIFDIPNNFASLWKAENINQIDIHKITIFSKGGNNPENISEKYVYTFDDMGNNNNYAYYNFENSQDPVNQLNYEYKEKTISKINIYKYFGVGNSPPVFVYKNKKFIVFYKSKADGKNDSLFFYPSVENPSIIIDKIGNVINYMEIFVEESSNRKKIINQVSEIDTNINQFQLADKVVTHIKNGLPVESYHLGENWMKLEQSKIWEYNSYKQPTHIKEWMHGNLTKDIQIFYNENSLPKKIEYNRKKYEVVYSKT